jgi:hypothetical protein
MEPTMTNDLLPRETDAFAQEDRAIALQAVEMIADLGPDEIQLEKIIAALTGELIALRRSNI